MFGAAGAGLGAYKVARCGLP
eukprot:SAG11_NODE_30179_length_303_cov_1.004902_2_plen_20_part_01